uniref:Si:ch211-180f4.1 n=1 Tax=Cyprinodon variegatus TaxID=28743 RepID=A0A3Q2D4G0_CYPVA
PVGGAVSCPLQCVCETRPWYTSQSVYHQARTVDCNELHLDRVPANISTDTQVLLLQSNNISSISTELQNMRNLTELDLSQNHFSQVSSMGLSSLVHLVTLYVEENHIQELEDFGLKNLTSLEELYINHNHISSIGPKAFDGLTNLLRLHLNSNRLVAIDSRWFESLPSLEILMIGENPILGLEEKNFLPLSRLHSLVLARMGLVSVPSAAFVGLDYLESLSFFDNKLRSVPRDALSELPNLKFLDLSRNPISRIQRGDFENLQHLEELRLGSEPNNNEVFVLRYFPSLRRVSRRICEIKKEKRKKHHMFEPGALVIEKAEPSDAGVYTCVAWNVEGADTRSVSVSVDFLGSEGGSSKRRLWAGNSSSSAASLVVLAKVVHAQSVVLEWKLYSSRGAVGQNQNQHDAALPLPRWTSAVVHIDNPQISYTAKVPADVQEYNLTHLLPATQYHVCLTVSSSLPPLPSAAVHTSCLNFTTKEAGFSVELVASQPGGVALAAVLGSMFALSIMTLLVVYMGRRVQQHKSCGHSLKKYMQHTASIPLNELYPPLITLWESEAEKDKEKEEEDGEGGARGEAGRNPINTSKTYMW